MNLANVRRCRALVVSAAVCALTYVPALAERLPIRAFTSADGLPCDDIRAILADSRGFVWFGTAEGLSRFDGHAFVNYGLRHGLPERGVYALLETREGVVWLSTGSRICRFNPDGAERFTCTEPDDVKKSGGGIALYEHALAIRENALGPDHPDVAKMLNNLCVVLRRMRRFQEARPVLERALSIRERVLGPKHRDVGTSLDNLALVLLELNDDARARELLERADAIFVETLGPDHPNRIEVHRALVIARRRTGDEVGARAAEALVGE